MQVKASGQQYWNDEHCTLPWCEEWKGSNLEIAFKAWADSTHERYVSTVSATCYFRQPVEQSTKAKSLLCLTNCKVDQANLVT